MHKKWCPVCNQGWVIPMRITSTSEIIQCCMECEAVWSNSVDDLSSCTYSEEEAVGKFWSLVPLLESKGINYTDGSIENVYEENISLWRG